MAHYLGIMSGTSLDAIDLVLCDIDDAGTTTTLNAISTAFPPKLHAQLRQLCEPQGGDINTMMVADVQFAEACASACQQLLTSHQLHPSDIKAIGFHGQTIRHFPQGRPGDADSIGFTLQIGDAQRLASRTGIAVVSDFRRKDIALGGQGAPLVPAFHHAAFADPQQHRAIVNIGGMANITWLPGNDRSRVIGFDTGPGNTLLDAWIHHHLGKAFDADGQFAQSGQCDPLLLESLLADPYFAKAPPKSTGREYFNLAWLRRHPRVAQLSAADVQATLNALTVHSIAQSIGHLGRVDALYLCGGGSHNHYLRHSLSSAVTCPIFDTALLGIAPDWVEGAAFAWLAWAFEHRVEGNLSAVTGARHAAILGQYCLPD